VTLRLVNLRFQAMRPPVAMLLLIGLLPALGAAAGQSETVGRDLGERFKFFVEESGVYSVTHEDLTEAGLGSVPVLSKNIGMTNLGEKVPVWIEDGGDGFFGAGDRVIFVGRRLKGEYSNLDEYSRFNCYVLDLKADAPVQGFDSVGVPGPDENRDHGELAVRRHLEEDTVMVRYPERPNEPQERWYWSRLSVTDREPFRMTLNLDGIHRRQPFDPGNAVDLRNVTVKGAQGEDVRSRLQHIFGSGESATGSVVLDIGMRGWSKPRTAEGLAHHEVSVVANGRVVSGAKWDGTEPFVHRVQIPLHEDDPDLLVLEIRVPKRRTPKTGDLFVDVLLLNWVDVEYRRTPNFSEGQTRFDIRAEADDGPLSVEIVTEGAGNVYGSGPVRLEIGQGPNVIATDILERGPFFAVIGGAFAAVDQIVVDTPSALKTGFRQTDYIIITHQKLIEAVQPLAEYHREEGLTVAVVDVEDIYDEFNFGIQHPRSLRDFLQWAYDNWPEPRPRFVLLAGDASWDFKNLTADDTRYADWTYRPGEARHFVKNSSSSYEENAEINHRNLVPTWGYRTSQGHAASDNWLVCLDGDDIYPDLAVGRIPVTEPAEMAAVIGKTISYAKEGPPGAWRKNLLFITNESKGFQRASDSTAEIFGTRGYVSTKIYPSPEETANEEHTQEMVQAFNRGLLMVQFLGHGGRYIWRTGPPDLKKNHDLFTLEHLDTLAPNERLPFVISLTCYSAPFDHPTADSIGEKLLRLDRKGAIGVFAASWRNSPSSNMGRIVMEELTTPGATLGEAIMRAKHRLRSPVLVETYNLLGDPAISLNLSADVKPPPPHEEGQKRASQGKMKTDVAPLTTEVVEKCATDGSGEDKE